VRVEELFGCSEMAGRSANTLSDHEQYKHSSQMPRWLAYAPRLTFCLLLPFGTVFAEEEEVLGWLPGPGDIDRAGTLGGGPGSAAGDRR
jgi:hypothetical protein